MKLPPIWAELALSVYPEKTNRRPPRAADTIAVIAMTEANLTLLAPEYLKERT